MHIIKKSTSEANRSMYSSNRIGRFKDYIWKQNRRRINQELKYTAKHWDVIEDFDILHFTMKEIRENWWYQW